MVMDTPAPASAPAGLGHPGAPATTTIYTHSQQMIARCSNIKPHYRMYAEGAELNYCSTTIPLFAYPAGRWTLLLPLRQ